jgi:hypothetical protein
VTDAGVNFRDYGTRVQEAKVKLDKFAAQPDKDAALHAKLDTILRLYLLAGERWRIDVARDDLGYAPLGERLMQPINTETCTAIAEIVATAKEEKPSGPAFAVGYRVKVPILWKCAASKLDEVH